MANRFVLWLLVAMVCEAVLGVGSSGNGVVHRSIAMLRSAKRYTPGGWWPLRANGHDCRYCGKSREAHHGTELFCTQSAETLRRQLDVVLKLHAIDAFLRRWRDRLRGRWADGGNEQMKTPGMRNGDPHGSLQLRGGVGSAIDYRKWDCLEIGNDNLLGRSRAQQEARRWDLYRKAEDGDFSSDLHEEHGTSTCSQLAVACAHEAGTAGPPKDAVVQEEGCVRTARIRERAEVEWDDSGAGERACSVEYEDGRRVSSRLSSTSPPRMYAPEEGAPPEGLAQSPKEDLRAEHGGGVADSDWARARYSPEDVKIEDEERQNVTAAPAVCHGGQDAQRNARAASCYISCADSIQNRKGEQLPSHSPARTPAVTLSNRAIEHATVTPLLCPISLP